MFRRWAKTSSVIMSTSRIAMISVKNNIQEQYSSIITNRDIVRI